jgi:hypothetical protein
LNAPPAAGTVAIPGFWAYLAIFAVVMIVSFEALDPDLLRERIQSDRGQHVVTVRAPSHGPSGEVG